MKLLLDECIPRRLKRDFRDHHDVLTVDEVGLKGVRNGQLLRAATERKFSALITVDQKIRFQQNLTSLNIAIVVLVAMPCRYPELQLLVPQVLESLEVIKPGEVIIIMKSK
ncbi:MAG TPA: DUF5615 family PIN-like protein [Pyrinomonadaceae bacterium]|jgi:predicted nuclease of predicted toxin-antitoxin system|nr:DUF5615 family PIN-like protein [Pyrinomonadaceae bacterium]